MNSETSSTMEYQQHYSQTRTTQLGWGILLGLNGLLIIDGVHWFFAGPNNTSARLVAVWFMAFGVLALMVALEGYRNGSRWAWYSSWVLVAALVALGLVEVRMEQDPFFGILLLGSSSVGVVGLLLARKSLS